MSTWADRLSVHKEPKYKKEVSPHLADNNKSYSHDRNLENLFSASSQQECAVKLTEFGLLSLVPGCFQCISSFLEYGDVLQLRAVCKLLKRYITDDDIIWEEQLRRFRVEMRNLYGATLLRTDFATSSSLSGFEQFEVEHKLYDFDSRRTWCLHEDSSIRDEETGMFTIPLYQAHEVSYPEDDFIVQEEQTVGAPPRLKRVLPQAFPISILQPKRSTHDDLVPVDMNDEEAVLRYVLALSAREGGSSASPHQLNPFEHAASTTANPFYHTGQLMSMVDELRRMSSTDGGRFEVMDITAEQNPNFVTALSLTLSAAKRRRLHLKNHHRALRNNGQSTRNRLGAQTSRVENTDQRLPAENQVLSCFTGQLLEISSEEMLNLSYEQLDKRWYNVIKAFIRGSGEVSSKESHVTERVYPPEWARYFLLPEVCKDHTLGLLVVDPLRALFLVQKEKFVDNDSDHEPDNIVAQHAVRYGRGYNANTSDGI